MLTAATSTDDIAACHAAGADAFLPKPIDFEQLKGVLGHYARGVREPGWLRVSTTEALAETSA
jgi:CheY-like chemotaxis protein